MSRRAREGRGRRERERDDDEREERRWAKEEGEVGEEREE